MVRRVQRKFWLIAMAAMGLCLIALIAVINLASSVQTERSITRAMDEMVETVEAVRGYAAAQEEPEWRVESYVEEETVTPEPTPTPSEIPSPSPSLSPDEDWDYGPWDDDFPVKGRGGKKQPWWYQDFLPAENDSEPEATPSPTAAAEEQEETIVHHYYYYYPEETDSDLRASAMNQYAGRLCVVGFPTDGGEPQVGMSDSSALGTEEAAALARQMLTKGTLSGDLDEYRYRVREDGETTWVYFLDCATERAAQRSLLLISILVGLAGLIVTGVFVYFMSIKATEPLALSMEKQKRFITDAGHELKTPLAVISTNMDILEMDLGKNEWVTGTKKQLVRLRKLVTNLISLSRLEETEVAPELGRFSLSDTALECADAFTGPAELAGKGLAVDIAPELFITGDVTGVGQLLTILCDNAVKYAEGDIQVRLYARGKRVIFETENPWNHGIPASELDRLFDRFYRGDAARSPQEGKTGYGLGLSIARALAEKNRGELTVEETPVGNLLFRASFHRVK